MWLFFSDVNGEGDMKKEFHLTADGVTELTIELENLKGRRGDIAEKLKTAREFGDLSENAEYDAARNEQARVENRIAELEHILKNTEIIEAKNSSEVERGNKVSLEGNGKEVVFTIVGSVEANPAESKISDESPMGRALMGKKVGENVEIKTPNGAVTKYKVTAIA